MDNLKEIYDPLHGYIQISSLALKIINTYEFQRLRDIKQLGTTYLVFPSATHTRFEHSLGVYYLCNEILDKINKKQPKLAINKKMMELIKIAGLVHDIGHGPFSHLYDSCITSEKHEERSKNIFKKMVTKYNLQLSNDNITFVCDCIDPPEHKKDIWYYQIVSNKVNTIDVDKIDYILRDAYHVGISISISNDYKRLLDVYVAESTEKKTSYLAFSTKVQFDIYNLFSSRYRLNKMVYTHHSVKSFEYLIIPILQEIIKNNNIDFLELSDSYVLNYLHNSSSKNSLKYNIYTRNIPKLINEITIQNINIINKLFDDKFYSGLLTTFDLFDEKEEDYILEKTLIGFSNSMINPLNNIYYYETNNKKNNNIDNAISLIDSQKYSFIIPQTHNELIFRLYSRNNKEKNIIKGKDIWNYILIFLNLK